MAINITFIGQRLHDMGDADTTTGIGSFSGAAPGLEPDFFYQGSNSISKKVGTSLNGVTVDTSAFGTPRSADMTAANRRLLIAKLQSTNSKALENLATTANDAAILRIGSISTAYYELDVADLNSWPIKGGWIIYPVAINETVFQGDVTGSPSLTAVDFFAYGSDFTATSRAENVMMDAVDVGRGLNIDTTASSIATIANLVTTDEGTNTNRWGFFSTIEGVIYVVGDHYFGRNSADTASECDLTDTNRVMIFPDGLFDAGDCGLRFDLGTSGTVINLSFITMEGRGVGGYVSFLGTAGINGGTEVWAQGVLPYFTQSFLAGTPMIYRKLGGAETTGLTDGTTYYVGNSAGQSPTQISTTASLTFHTTRRLSFRGTGGTPVGLTAPTNHEYHALECAVDTRPHLICTGTTGTFALSDSVLTNFRDITLTSVCTMTRCTFNRLGAMTQAQAQLIDCNFNDAGGLLPGVAMVTSPDLNDISGCSFTATNSRGHAIKITTPSTYGFVSNTFTGYDPTTYEKSFHTITDVDAATDLITITSHPYTTGDAVVYSDENLSDTVGLTDNTVYYIRSASANTISLHVNEGDAVNNQNLVNLSDGAAGQTHKIYGANAAIWNDSGGLVTINVTTGSTPSIRNTSGSTTAVNNSLTYVLTDIKSGSEVRIFRVSDGVELDGIESSGTSFSYGYTYASDTPIVIHIHHLDYEWLAIADTLVATSKSTKVFQRADRNSL